MTAYQWPDVGYGDEADDDAGGRARFVNRFGIAPTRETIESARETVVAHRRALAANSSGPGTDGSGASAAPGGVLPPGQPTTRQRMWVPLGPATVVDGQTVGNQRVTGRVRDMWVSPDGQRIYAGLAMGGVWYSPNAGASWTSLGGFGSSDDFVRPANRFVTGSILVQPDPAAPNDPARDTVFVGTGELIPNWQKPWSLRPGRKLGGEGVFVAVGPAASDAVDPWDVEATNLAENGIFRLAFDGSNNVVVAATSTGLRQRPTDPDERDVWERVDGDPFDSLEDRCTDVLWTAATGGRPERLWVWVGEGDDAGLWVRDGAAGSFAKIATPGFSRRRGALAASTPPSTVYLVNNKGGSAVPALYRITGAGAAAPVAQRVKAATIPDFVGGQGDYDLAIAVDPSDPKRVALGGSEFRGSRPEGGTFASDGAIFSDIVDVSGPDLIYGPAGGSAQLIGVGCYVDVHVLRWANGGNELWAGCDGGVFRSGHPAKTVGFVARNNGISAIQSNFVAGHPQCEGWLVSGLQDNGVIERRSSSVWYHSGDFDGGDVVIDPSNPGRYFRQFYNGDWIGVPDVGIETMLHQRPPGAGLSTAGQAELDGAAFYSSADAIAHPDAGRGPQVIIGTTRVWYSEDWGANWVTLPTAVDPIGVATYNSAQDPFGSGEQITACAWATPDVAWIMGDRRVERLVRQPGSDAGGVPGNWSYDPVLRVASGKKANKDKKAESQTEGPIRKAESYTALAPDPSTPPDPGNNIRGGLYLGAVGDPDDDDVDTVWWFDGVDTWHPTGLRTVEGIEAPVMSVVCDPVSTPEGEHVYVGTTVGVWHGTRTEDLPNPEWEWEPLVNGLPEAPVEDLDLYDHAGLRLLRAAVAARGIWEIRLDADAVDLTYLRAHDDDLRYRPSAVMVQRDGTTARSWHGSPDIQLRPTAAPAAAPADLPWTRTMINDDRAPLLQRFQAALRSQSNDDRVQASGAWDHYFSEVLRDTPGAEDPGTKVVSLTKAIWNSVMVAPHHAAEPWGAGSPSEADLHDLITRQTEGEVDEVSCEIKAGPMKVEVVVHHRGLDVRPGAGVRVTLLRWTRPTGAAVPRRDDTSTWFTGNVPWTTAVNEVLNSSGGTTSETFGGGWRFVGTNAAARRKTLTGITLDNMTTGVATFDLDLSPFRNGTVMILAAVVRAEADLTLTPKTLEDMVVERPELAVRSLLITR